MSAPQGCGLALHPKTGVACRSTRTEGQEPGTARRTWRPLTAALGAWAAWRPAAGGPQVAMDSPDVDWRPVSQRRAGQCALLVVHAQPIRAVPGRQTDVPDAAWIAELLRHGGRRGRCRPAKPQGQVRERTRDRRTLVQDHARALHRWPAVWEDAHVQRASVVPEISGGSARALGAALLAGQRAVEARAAVARGRLRAKRDQRKEAWEGRGTAPPSFFRPEPWSALAS